MKLYTQVRVLLGIMLIFTLKSIAILMASGNETKPNNSSSEVIFASVMDHFNASEKLFFSNSSKMNEPSLRNIFPESYFCGQIIGGHYMFGSASSYCGGYTIRDCSTQCFYRNFTYFQCEGLVCHCYS